MTWVVPPEWDGHRADKVLAQLADSSRAAAKLAIETGEVTVDDQTVAPRDPVAAGAVMRGTVAMPDATLEPEPVEFSILHEDDDLAIVDKPAGIVTHPGAGTRSGTLAGGLLHRWPRIRGVGEEGRWGIVHRLDRDTSGLLVVALSPAAHTALTDAIRRRAVEREYLCLVFGRPTTPTGTVDAAIGRDPRRPTRMRLDREGRHAVTHYRLERASDTVSLLRVTLETGRTHQIRVHLGSIGLPVVGDGTYGRHGLSPRVFLHSTRIALDHPVTGTRVEAESPMPADLADVVAEVFGDEPGAAGIVE